MGQQQLLLLALSTIIVGLAIVMGINMFGENAAQSNLDAVTNDVLTIASRAQGWYRKPAQMGGGGRSFSGLSGNPALELNFPDSTENGSYLLSSPTDSNIVITGTGVEDINGNGSPLSVQVTVYADRVTAATITQ
ncbi:MAG: hypothetical protein H6695_13440 [Deferribacteres bacterium]|nr:hypothetical protein [Deferribacteres bacterium]